MNTHAVVPCRRFNDPERTGKIEKTLETNNKLEEKKSENGNNKTATQATIQSVAIHTTTKSVFKPHAYRRGISLYFLH